MKPIQEKKHHVRGINQKGRRNQMKMYEIEVYAQKTIVVSASNEVDARKKARIKFLKNPGRLDMEDIREGP